MIIREPYPDFHWANMIIISFKTSLTNYFFEDILYYVQGTSVLPWSGVKFTIAEIPIISTC